MLTNQRVFAAWPTSETRIPVMVDFFAWYPPNDVSTMLSIGRQRSLTLPQELAERAPGQRVMQLRWLFVYEADVRRYGADPVAILENGFVPIGRTIRMLRPMCNMLKRQNLIPDAVWIDTESGFDCWTLSADQFNRVYASSRARANMPASIRNLTPADYSWTRQGYQQNIIAFNRWTAGIMTQAIRRALIDSGLFVFNTPNGPYVPPICRYTGVAPTWPVYDPNGWPLMQTSIDGRTSNTFFYNFGGNRATVNRTHDYRWNLLVDICNWGRSFMHRANGIFWPLVSQPVYYHNSPWYFEQIIAHLSRLGVTTNNGNGWIFWNEHDDSVAMAGQGQIVYETLARHDQPFPVQRDLPQLELDCDQIETAGYVTTYEDFLTNMGLPAPSGAGAGNP